MTFDLRNYFVEEVANDLKRDLVVKVIVGRTVKNKTAVKSCLMSLQMDMLLDPDIGLDWFDYGFAEASPGKIKLSFYRVLQDKKKKRISITVDYQDAKVRDTKHILGVIKTAKASVNGGWA